jgi:plastocyanin
MIGNSILAVVLSSVTLFAVACAHGAELTVDIIDLRGDPVPDAVVTAAGPDATGRAGPVTAPAVMDQIGLAFVPAVLVVRTGTPVIFPNSDTVAHQVYSFSPAKRFQLGLYRGDPHPPVVLDQPGLIVLGCNIHDNMVGYIYVTDSPYFGKSDADGTWQASGLPPGEYEVTLWSSRLPRDAATVKQRVTLGDAAPARVQIRLQQSMRPAADANRDPRIRDY